MTIQKIALGQIYTTPGIQQAIPFEALVAALARHSRGDWGDLSEEDKQVNEEAIETGDRIMSAYVSNGVRFWIITEGEPRYTTVLLPDEY